MTTECQVIEETPFELRIQYTSSKLRGQKVVTQVTLTDGKKNKNHKKETEKNKKYLPHTGK